MPKEPKLISVKLLPEIRKLAKIDSVAAAKLCQSALTKTERGFHREMYGILAGVYALSNFFDTNKTAWRAFRKEEFWRKCKQKTPTADDDHDAIILWVSRFAFRAADTQSPRYNRAYKHARTLQRYAREKVSETKVAEKLANEGADYLFRLETEEHPRRSKPGESDPSAASRKANGTQDQASNASRTDSDGGVEQKLPRGRTSSAVSGDETPPATAKPPIKFQIGPELQRELLAVPAGRRVWVTLERFEGDSVSPCFRMRPMSALTRAERQARRTERQALRTRATATSAGPSKRPWSTINPFKV